MVNDWMLTDAESKRIREGAAAYDREAQAEISAQREYAEDPIKQDDFIAETYALIKADNLDMIRFLGEDIGALNKVRETWRGNEEIQEYAKYLILMDQEIMSEITKEIMDGSK